MNTKLCTHNTTWCWRAWCASTAGRGAEPCCAEGVCCVSQVCCKTPNFNRIGFVFFLNEPVICLTLRALCRKESLSCLTEHRHLQLPSRAIIHTLCLRSLPEYILHIQIAIKIQRPGRYHKLIAGEGRTGCIWAVSIAGRAKRKHLPERYLALRKKIHESVCALSEIAYAILRRQRCYVHQHADFPCLVHGYIINATRACGTTGYANNRFRRHFQIH